MNRRDAVSGLILAGAAVTTGGMAMAEKQKDDAAHDVFEPGKHVIRPLPFDAKKLAGISERMILSHHENNYGGAVKNLNKTELEIAKLAKDAPGFVVSGLRERELQFSNSLALHELYFANLGGDGKPAGAVQKAIATAWGSFDAFESALRATGTSLGGGSGWTVVDFDLHAGGIRIRWSGNHTQSPAASLPLLVLDMYEHSYAIDYGAAAAKYLDAFFQNVRWEEIDRRYERARKAFAAISSPS